MDRLDAMHAFVTVVDRGSLAAAARQLGRSAATVTRAIGLLESHLDTRLLHRSTRALKLTDVGTSYLATCRDVLATLAAASRGAEDAQARPTGLVSLTAPHVFGQLHVRPVVDSFLDANPAVRARLLLLDRIVNLVDEGLDIAVRIGRLPDSNLLATRVGEVRRVLCAAPAYLARRGAPKTPADLREHACVFERDGADADSWKFAASRGAVAIQPRLVVNSAAAAVDSAREGHGITRVMSYQAASAIAAGELVVLLGAHEPPPMPVHLVLPAGSRAATPRAFVEHAAPLLRERLADVARRLASGSPRRAR